MRQARRVIRRLGSITAVAAVLVAAAVLASPLAQAMIRARSSSVTRETPDTTAPTGAVSGVGSPVEAGSTLSLTIDASDAGSGLVSAQASINGSTSSVSLCPESGKCPETVSGVPLSIGVGGEGSHELLVTVTDAAGNTATLVARTIEVLAPLAPVSNEVTVGISGGHGGPPDEEPTPTPSPTCGSPMLSMRLASRPVRYVKVKERRIPVLRAGHAYRYSGRLTCLPPGSTQRVPAPDGTVVHVLYELGRRTVKAGRGTMTVHEGALGAALGFTSARTVIFRYSQAGGEDVGVRIRTKIARRHPHKHRSKKRGAAR